MVGLLSWQLTQMKLKKNFFNLYDDLYFLIRILEFSDKTKNIDYYDDQVSMLDFEY